MYIFKKIMLCLYIEYIYIYYQLNDINITCNTYNFSQNISVFVCLIYIIYTQYPYIIKQTFIFGCDYHCPA